MVSLATAAYGGTAKQLINLCRDFESVYPDNQLRPLLNLHFNENGTLAENWGFRFHSGTFRIVNDESTEIELSIQGGETRVRRLIIDFAKNRCLLVNADPKATAVTWIAPMKELGVYDWLSACSPFRNEKYKESLVNFPGNNIEEFHDGFAWKTNTVYVENELRNVFKIGEKEFQLVVNPESRACTFLPNVPVPDLSEAWRGSIE